MRKLGWLLLSVCLITSCSLNNQKNNEHTNTGCEINYQDWIPSYASKMVINELADGWYEVLEIQADKIDPYKRTVKDNVKEEFNYLHYDVVNINYKKIPGFYVPILDENNQEIGVLNNSLYPSYFNNEQYKQELIALNYLLNNSLEINEESLKELNLQNFDAKHLYELYQKLMNQDYVDYQPLVPSNYDVQVLADEFYQIGYIACYGELLAINIIDLANPDDDYNALEQKLLQLQTINLQDLSSNENDNLQQSLNKIKGIGECGTDVEKDN